jgi:hypothetical protein
VAWFRISFAENAFLRVLTSRGLTLDSLTVDDGVAAMVEFYREHRAQHTRLEDDDDGLLLQWSSGRLDLTRQLIRSGSPDSPIRQLSLAFVVDARLPPAGSEWFFDPTAPIPVPTFFTGTPSSVTLSYETV